MYNDYIDANSLLADTLFTCPHDIKKIKSKKNKLIGVKALNCKLLLKGIILYSK